MEKEREQSKFLIQRFDAYTANANTKGNFLLAFNTFLCGGIVTNYDKLSAMIQDATKMKCLNIFLFALFIIGLFTTWLIMQAVYPFLKSGNSSKDKYHSLIFFNSVAEFESDKHFATAFQKQEDLAVDEDIARQAYQLAKGLKSKYNRLAWAMRLVFVELILLFISLIIVTIY